MKESPIEIALSASRPLPTALVFDFSQSVSTHDPCVVALEVESSFLINAGIDAGPGPKFASLERRSGPAQILWKFQSYDLRRLALKAASLAKRWVRRGCLSEDCKIAISVTRAQSRAICAAGHGKRAHLRRKS